MRKMCMILLGLGLFGCNADMATTTQSQTTFNSVHRQFSESMRENVIGRYQSTCHESYYQGLHLYAITVEVFSHGSQMNRAFYFYKDSSCQISFGQAEDDGRFEFSDGGIAFGIQYSHFKPETVQVSNLLDTAHFLGRTDWQVGNWTNTQTSEYQVEMQLMSPEDDFGNVLIRTECSDNTQGRCVNVRLVRTTDT